MHRAVIICLLLHFSFKLAVYFATVIFYGCLFLVRSLVLVFICSLVMPSSFVKQRCEDDEFSSTSLVTCEISDGARRSRRVLVGSRESAIGCKMARDEI